jgi:hypothetical protein
MKKNKYIQLAIDEVSLKKFEEKIKEKNKNISEKITKSNIIRKFIDKFTKGNE